MNTINDIPVISVSDESTDNVAGIYSLETYGMITGRFENSNCFRSGCIIGTDGKRVEEMRVGRRKFYESAGIKYVETQVTPVYDFIRETAKQKNEEEKNDGNG